MNLLLLIFGVFRVEKLSLLSGLTVIHIKSIQYRFSHYETGWFRVLKI